MITDSTFDLPRTRNAQRAAVWTKRAAITLLVVLLALGASGLLGGMTARASGTSDGITLSVVYPRVARAGADMSIRITVDAPAGLGDTVTLGISGTYLDLFDVEDIQPQPSESARDGRYVFLTFDVVDGADVLVVDLGGRVQSSAQQGTGGQVAIIAGSEPQQSVAVSTVLIP